LHQKFDASSSQVFVQETFTTNVADAKYDTNNVSQKHSQSIKSRYFGHMHTAFLHGTELRCICCRKHTRKKLVHVQESMTHVQDTCASWINQTEKCHL